MTEVTVEGRGRIVIPKDIRESLEIRGGEKLSVRQENGRIVISRQKGAESLKDLKGCVESTELDPMEARDIWEE